MGSGRSVDGHGSGLIRILAGHGYTSLIQAFAGQGFSRATGLRRPGHAPLRWSGVARLWALLLLSGCGGPPHIQISEGGAGAYEASLAPVAGGWAVAWHDTRDGHPEIYARLLDADGSPTGPPRRLTDTPSFSYEPHVAAAGAGELVVAWYAVSVSGASATYVDVWNLTEDAGPRWTRTLSNPVRLGRNVVVRVKNDRLFCAWIEKGDDAGDDAVWAQWLDLDLDGQPLSPPQRLADAGPTTWNLNGAIDGDGQAWVVFDATRHAERRGVSRPGR